VREAGAGRVVPCERVAIGKALAEMIADRDSLAKTGAIARSWAMKTFAWETIAQRVDDMYRAVAAAGQEQERS